MLLLDEKQEVLTLITQCLKNDLNHQNHFIAGLALCTMGNISSAGIARDLAPDIEKLLGSSHPYLRKKAALCAIRVLRKCPDLMENFVPRIRALLSEKSHGVLITGVTLMTELCKTDAHNIEFFRRLVPTLVRVLKGLVMSGYAPEYDVSGITDPFLQVKILHLLALLGKGDNESSDIMNDILAQVATNTDNSRNAGNAILYECVKTIMYIESESALRVLAINILGRFLQNRDNNIRYVALNTLAKVVQVDVEAVQRHRNTIVDCLKDIDISIRRRALELLYLLINENNIQILVGELLNYLGNSTADLRTDLADKICDATERFSPNKPWHVDTIVKVMQIAGNSVPEDVAANLINLIASSPELHEYAVQKMYSALKEDLSQQTLIQVAVWCVGEFGNLLLKQGIAEDEIITTLEKIFKSGASSPTKIYCLTACMKLTNRLTPNALSKLRALISSFQNNIDVELQQRSCEYAKIFQAGDNVRKTLFEPIPIQEEKAKSVSAASVKSKNILDIDDKPSQSSSQPTQSSTGGGSDILNELFGSTATPSKPAPTNQKSPSPLDLISELSIGTGPSIQPTPSNPTSPLSPILPTPLNGPLPPFVAFQKNGLTITFNVIKQASTPNVTAVTAAFSNSNSDSLNNFDFKIAVPKYVKLQVNPPSGNVVPASNSGSVTQSFKLLNTLHGEKPLVIKTKIDYQLSGLPVSEIADINFPQGC
jgi:AP-1 complex subunit gamma-1